MAKRKITVGQTEADRPLWAKVFVTDWKPTTKSITTDSGPKARSNAGTAQRSSPVRPPVSQPSRPVSSTPAPKPMSANTRKEDYKAPAKARTTAPEPLKTPSRGQTTQMGSTPSRGLSKGSTSAPAYAGQAGDSVAKRGNVTSYVKSGLDAKPITPGDKRKSGGR